MGSDVGVFVGQCQYDRGSKNVVSSCNRIFCKYTKKRYYMSPFCIMSWRDETLDAQDWFVMVSVGDKFNPYTGTGISASISANRTSRAGRTQIWVRWGIYVYTFMHVGVHLCKSEHICMCMRNRTGLGTRCI